MKIAIGSDHRGYELKEKIKRCFKDRQLKYEDFGAFSQEKTDYPIIVEKVAIAVQKKECDLGILICGTGFGMCITANKFKGIRATTCYNEETAKLSRLHNNANILTMGANYLDIDEAMKIVDAWLNTEFEGGRHKKRIEEIEEIENHNMK